jgi:hypothetical protein
VQSAGRPVAVAPSVRPQAPATAPAPPRDGGAVSLRDLVDRKI